MIDGTTRLLLERYSPADPRLQEAPTAKSNIIPKGPSLKVVMDSSVLGEDLCMHACNMFNSVEENKGNQHKNYILPAALDGIPAGSWVRQE